MKIYLLDAPFLEVNDVYAHHARHGKGRGPEHGRDDQEKNHFPGVNHSSNKKQHQKEKRKDEKRDTIACF